MYDNAAYLMILGNSSFFCCWITLILFFFYISKIIFFTMLIMYSAFVLTSVSTKYYEQNLGRIFEYYVYFWGAGDLIEELTCCFVSFLRLIDLDFVALVSCNMI